MKNYIRFSSLFKRGLIFQNRGFATKSTAYDPKIVNEAINPRPGRLFKSTPLLFLLAVSMLTVPVVVTYYDNKDFEKEMERRKQPGVTY
ncbi:putative integral membrane protein [Theileria parva strain Muguga]|uniref:Uncharacterized protein n=1 Tax=Theileria parva TaxID=5875 RepID=Q4MYN4_THEPA|nr:putative integral membrane protein [Theileria parva strain Muguga]EAN30648.1 putative integral membrane protein [Theileria parva strain Muguga]|eukprot:XP_762931.1 hypothetical protein [Theileria parva strain Muguga]